MYLLLLMHLDLFKGGDGTLLLPQQQSGLVEFFDALPGGVIHTLSANGSANGCVRLWFDITWVVISAKHGGLPSGRDSCLECRCNGPLLSSSRITASRDDLRSVIIIIIHRALLIIIILLIIITLIIIIVICM